MRNAFEITFLEYVCWFSQKKNCGGPSRKWSRASTYEVLSKFPHSIYTIREPCLLLEKLEEDKNLASSHNTVSCPTTTVRPNRFCFVVIIPSLPFIFFILLLMTRETLICESGEIERLSSSSISRSYFFSCRLYIYVVRVYVWCVVIICRPLLIIIRSHTGVSLDFHFSTRFESSWIFCLDFFKR